MSVQRLKQLFANTQVRRRRGAGGGGCRAAGRQCSDMAARYPLVMTAHAQASANAPQARYRAALAALDAELRAPVFRHVAAQLAPVVDPRCSSVFDDILY